MSTPHFVRIESEWLLCDCSCEAGKKLQPYAKGEIAAHRLWYKTHDGRWELHGRPWVDGEPDPQLVKEIIEPGADRWRLEYAYKGPSDLTPAESESVPVYQVRARGVEIQWSDVNHNGFLAALAMRSMEARILYSAPPAITKQSEPAAELERGADA